MNSSYRENNNAYRKITSTDKKLVLYGAGSFGTSFKKIIDKFGIKAECFCVTTLKDNKREIEGLKVYELDSLPFKADECCFLLSLNESMHKAITEELEKRNFKNHIAVTQADMDLLLEDWIQYFFQSKGIDTSCEYIDCNGCKIVNGLIKKEIKQSFLYEAGDLIFPIFGDYSLLSEGPYEYSGVTLDSGDTVIDLGANIGLFSSVAASKGCKIYAFEPFPQVINYLCDLSQVYPEQITIVPEGASDCAGSTNMFIFNENTSNSIVFSSKSEVSAAKTITIPTTTIDQFINDNKIEKIDFIKADIEGSERLMLKGAVETLKKFAPKLSLCTYHVKDDPLIMEELILKANPSYRIEHKWKKLYAYVP